MIAPNHRGHYNSFNINLTPLTSAVKINFCGIKIWWKDVILVCGCDVHYMSTRGQCVQCIQSDVTFHKDEKPHKEKWQRVSYYAVCRLEEWSTLKSDHYLDMKYVFFPPSSPSRCHIMFCRCSLDLIMEQFSGSVFYTVHLAMSNCKLKPVMIRLAVWFIKNERMMDLKYSFTTFFPHLFIHSYHCGMVYKEYRKWQ